MPMLLTRAVRKLSTEVRYRIGPEPEWLGRKRIVDRVFDFENGVDTGGITRLNKLGIASINWRDGLDHIAADPAEFRTAIESLNLDFEGWTFVDLGSGKGRALLLAAAYPFMRIIGVEFAASLVEVARANLAKLSKERDVSRIQVDYADAAEYSLPGSPTILFLYNPFGPALMEKVAARTRQSLIDCPRELIVLYLNPFQLGAWLKCGFTQVKRGSHFAVLRFEPAQA